MFVTGETSDTVVLENGVRRTIKGYLPELMVVELVWQKGMVGAVHSHPHRQCAYIISGSFQGELDGQKRVLGPGDCFYAQDGVPHGLTALEDNSVMLDIFTPMREDFLPHPKG